MNLHAEGLSLSWMVGSLLIWAGLLVWSLRTAPWYKVHNDKEAQHVLLGASMVVFLVWLFGASIGNGLTFHFLFMTTLTLMFGPQFAFIAMSLALVGVTLQSDLGFMAFGLNAILMGVIPIFITWWMARWAYKVLDHNIFVFVFFNAFLSASVGIVMSLGVSALVLYAAEIHSYDILKQSFIPYIPLMATPEGFVNGMLMTAFILFKPEWVSSFSDREYFK
ncbi:energy-coupling factor ABC transporter permease [Thiomicrorhabdus sp. ZW0627]|uniref:energy-coupling factor ABC transporter permease n=1 Tax=Thiomicrorhabdus sp. ZW0627 TaxID=3039774 RepID=UPI0024368EE4|nr:energy-coupling factor ABC transporter permease [Thiomicrorhabdus sp. ZW0627]MDG6773466.1 energy-coupling factor ABC transporter permease [Thiomicrorhabdus sp. ZW0627]